MFTDFFIAALWLGTRPGIPWSAARQRAMPPMVSVAPDLPEDFLKLHWDARAGDTWSTMVWILHHPKTEEAKVLDSYTEALSKSRNKM